jgi:hypothetical protein
MNARRLGCIVLMLATLTIGARGGDRINIRVSPVVAMAPADLIVRMTVEANASNRAVEVIMDSEDFYRSSRISLDGDQAPRTTRVEFHGVPGGAYTVRAVLTGVNDEQLALARQDVNIVPSGSDR